MPSDSICQTRSGLESANISFERLIISAVGITPGAEPPAPSARRRNFSFAEAWRDEVRTKSMASPCMSTLLGSSNISSAVPKAPTGEIRSWQIRAQSNADKEVGVSLVIDADMKSGLAVSFEKSLIRRIKSLVNQIELWRKEKTPTVGPRFREICDGN